MKNIFVKSVASLLAAFTLVGCSSDYLDVKPQTAVTTATVQTTEEGATAALNGLCRAMYYPYTDFDLFSQLGYNGEAWIMMFYGDVMSQDYFSYMWASSLGSNFTWNNNTMVDGWVSQAAWIYTYNLISQANTILEGIDNINGDKAHLNYIKAQALTIRAHAYFRTLQIYGPRWEDSNNGEKYVCVIRTKPGTSDVPLSKMNEVIDLIKSDLDAALEIYDTHAYRRSYIWEPDEDIANGVYARLGLLIHDYKMAQTHAKAARSSYPILSAQEYKSGFAKVQNSYIWANPVMTPSEGSIGYYGHGSYYACQGPYPTDWELGAGQINYELYRQIPKGDIRADLFFTPDKLSGTNALKVASFWNDQICNPANMDLSKLNSNMKNELTRFGNASIPNGDVAQFGQPYVSRSGSKTNPVIAFGAQYKFWGLDMYGTNSFPFMRAEEMLLTEAEAAYMNGDESTAKACLKLLIDQRNPGQSVDNLSGQALLNQVKLQRRIELWGEGHNWFDLKRWNEPMIRNVWVKGDVNSNNIPASYKLNKQPGDANGWRYCVPQSESQYNSLINRALLD